MKKHIHLGLCCLLSGLMISASTPIQSTTIELTEDSQDNRTGRILSSVSEVVEGLIKLIKNPHEKANVLHNVGKMLAGIMNVAAGAVQKTTPLTADEMSTLLGIIQDLNLTIDQTTQDTLLKHALIMHNYLRTISTEELEAFLHRSDEAQAQGIDDEATLLDNEDHALQSGILGSLHEMIHELFAIIQNPENPQLIGQHIADIMNNIMNIASQAIKYEYMTSKNAEETVALYLDSFSTELTKKITHLMLQTALHIRETRSRSCCKTSCCGSSCCNSGGCKPCCRTIEPIEENALRGCGSCGKCNSGCGKCCTTTTTNTGLVEANETEIMRGCCGKCNSGCGKCCTTTTTPTVTLVDATQDETTRSCCSCNNSCGKCCRTGEATPEDEATRACCSCSNSCGKCCRTPEATQDEATRNCCSCNNSCGKCCRTGESTLEDEATRACCSCSNSCGKCCRTTIATTIAAIARCSENCMCSPCECTPDHRSARCGCNKPRPTTPRDVTVDETNVDDETRCGCNKPKPQPTVTNRKRISRRTTA